MTTRRITTLGLAAGLSAALLVAPTMAEASPMLMSSPTPAAEVTASPFAPAVRSPFASLQIGSHPLAGYAKVALNEWYIFTTTGLGEHLGKFIAIRDSIAAAAAADLGIDPARMVAAWAKADHRHQVVLMAALTQLGVRYTKRVNEPGKGFDCSGFTSFAWSATGVTMPRQSRRQINAAFPLDASTAQPGDLVYYPGHISLYLGVDMAILHSPTYGDHVRFGHVRSSRQRVVRFGSPLI